MTDCQDPGTEKRPAAAAKLKSRASRNRAIESEHRNISMAKVGRSFEFVQQYIGALIQVVCRDVPDRLPRVGRLAQVCVVEYDLQTAAYGLRLDQRRRRIKVFG